MRFRNIDIYCFDEAAEFVKNLPYKRNPEKENMFCVFDDNGGTCSTKHALLKKLADENGEKELKLMLGIFRMNGKNTPKISSVLEKYHLKEIPEAHNYLKFKSLIIDCTNSQSSSADFVDDLVEETEIAPYEITDFKIKYHQNFIKNYLEENPEIPFDIDEFWKIREECIAELQK